MFTEKVLCADCVDDGYIRVHIRSSGDVGTRCSYCNSEARTMTLGDLVERCEQVFSDFYEGTADDDKVVHFDRDPDGDPIESCLEELLGDHPDLIDDLRTVLLTRLGGETLDEADPYYIRRSRLEGRIGYQWQKMSESLKYEARLVNPEAIKVLDFVFGDILNDETEEGFDVFVNAGPSIGLNKLYRARVFQSDDALESAMAHPERELGPHPKGRCRAGRMNASGVSVFYGATDVEVALAEVRPPVGSRVLVGQFSITRSLRLVNLDELARIKPSSRLSLFDSEAVHQYSRRDFLANLTHRLTMPVMPEMEDQSYIITQVIADYLATNEKLNVDGIYFKSAQISGHDDDHPGRNVVLFHKASRVERAESQFREGRYATLMEHEEEHTYMSPSLHWDGKEPAGRRHGWEYSDQRELALHLDLKSMEIRTIKAVSYVSEEDSVSFVDTSKPFLFARR
ncbi:RES domain-containing protein [Xanthomonas cannabis]|uniref:RES domain-containing protein n=1 Tax=Xanthomonas cannabis TaxID=1885674 RepID=UPI0009DDFEF8|nr:RES domain-containing protein [Xanthomonas cannabis]